MFYLNPESNPKAQNCQKKNQSPEYINRKTPNRQHPLNPQDPKLDTTPSSFRGASGLRIHVYEFFGFARPSALNPKP